MRVIHNLDEMTETARGWLIAGTVGIVPTAGPLHTGHVTLIRSSLQTCELSVVSILANTAQFGINEDQPHYAYNLTEHLQLLDGGRGDVVFIPRPEDFYPT